MDQPTSQRRQSSLVYVYMLLIVSIAVCLRIYNLDNLSFWLDEGFSVWACNNASLKTLYWKLLESTDHPFYLFLLYLWMKLSVSDFWVRLLSALFGIAAVPFIFLLGKSLFDRQIGILSAVFLAIHPFHIQYSQEARAYSLFFLVALVAALFISQIVNTNRMIFWVGYVISATLLLYTHGIAMLFLFSFTPFFLCLAWPISRGLMKRWILAHILILILYSPWIGIYINKVKFVADIPADLWMPRPTVSSIINTIVQFTCPFLTSIRFLLVSCFILYCSAIYFGCKLPRKRVGALFVLSLLPIISLFFVSITIRSIYTTRVLIPALIAVPILLSVGFIFLYRTYSKTLASVVLICSLASLILSSYMYFTHFKKEDWKGAVKYFFNLHHPGDAAIFIPKEGQRLFNWYLREKTAQVSLLKGGRLGKVRNREDISSLQRQISAFDPKRIWLFESDDVNSIDPERWVKKWLDADWKLVSHAKFHELQVDMYVHAAYRN